MATWEPYGTSTPDTLSITTGTRKVHGNQRLPGGYMLAFVPRVAKVAPLDDADAYTIPPLRTGLLKGLVTLAQAVYALFTFSMALKGQLVPYGYAAFGLTVLPYAVMSGLNLLGALFTPEFDELYLVESDVLLEARTLPGAKFERVVGKLLPVDPQAPDVSRLFENTLQATVKLPVPPGGGNGCIQIKIEDYCFELTPRNPNDGGLVIEVPACGKFQEHHSWLRETLSTVHATLSPYFSPFSSLFRTTLLLIRAILPSVSLIYFQARWLAYSASKQGTLIALAALAIVTNLAIYGAIFIVPGGGGTDTSISQRVWIVLWLVTGTAFGALTSLGQFFIPSHRVELIISVVALCIVGIPAVGGFRVVVMMLLQYGTCVSYT
ncbi:hypothetical protein B0H19DRAFT_1083142 [Mycena capillaripes]|nr:hypothetical protein B0H19DRAFT_1083142 [Mycena capillaripes]